jgi:branched-chain amino acid transport system substrate-binding protein
MSRRHRRQGQFLSLAVVGLLLLAACGSDKKKTTAASASGGGAKCSGIALGFFGALTGDSANLGINERNGAKLAVNQFNAANAGCQVGFKEFDSAGDPAQAPALAQKAVQDTSLVALIGPAFSGESKVADPIFNEGGLGLITTSATNPGLSTHGWTIFHRAVGNDNAQGPAAAKYLLETLKAKKVAVLDDASEYGKGIADIVRQKLRDGGATIPVSEAIDPKGTDFSSTVTKVKAASVDAVFLGGYYQAGGVLAKQLKDGGVTATFMGPDGVNDKGFVTAAGAAAEGAILLAPGTPTSKAQGADKFLTDYKAAFGQDAGLYSLESFDAGNAELEAITKGNVTRKAINDYMNNTLDYKGISVELKFDSKGELATKATIWASKVQGGQIVPDAPISA